MDLSKAVRVMELAALKAGRHLLTLNPGTTRMESRKDFLSSADLESDNIIRDILHKDFPDIYYSSEEMENDDPTKGIRFKVDPVDGTVNFFIGDDNYAVSIALVEDGETKAGVVYFPAKTQLFSATVETVATLRRPGYPTKRLLVNDEDTLENSQFWVEWGKDVPGGEETARVHEVLRKLRYVSLYPQIRNCAAGNPMAVARGMISGFVMTKPDPFDVAAAGLIVRQAGGTVTDLEGRAWNANSKSIVATNGHVHAALLELLNS